MRAWLPMAAIVLAGTGLTGLAENAEAHHSFAVYFDSTKDIRLEGTVKAFRFTNPHGLIVLDVEDAQGRHQEWRAETNAPVVLQRRGWRRDSINPGDHIRIEGWPSRDGKPYLRLRSAHDAQGRLIGTEPFGQTDQS